MGLINTLAKLGAIGFISMVFYLIMLIPYNMGLAIVLGTIAINVTEIKIGIKNANE